MININIINSLLYVHVKANKTADIEGLVLPLYDKFLIKKNEFTY